MKPRYLSLRPLIPWRQLERPVFRDGALDVEIGAGNGEFLARNASEHPDRSFVAIEKEWGSVQRILRRTAQTSLNNVRVLLADAQVALERLFAPGTIRRAYSLFPCPWPKKRHARRRLFSRDFLSLLNNRLVDGGEFQIVTDHRPFVEWIREEVPTEGLSLAVRNVDPGLDTKYERKWIKEGHRDFVELTLTQTKRLPVIEKEEDNVETHKFKDFDPDRFQPRDESGEISVIFKEFLYDPKRHVAMSHVLVSEDGLTQKFWIQIAKRGEEWHIGPSSTATALPTVGVQRALDLVRDACR